MALKTFTRLKDGAKQKYGEPTKVVNTRVPISKVAEFKEMAREWLSKILNNDDQ